MVLCPVFSLFIPASSPLAPSSPLEAEPFGLAAPAVLSCLSLGSASTRLELSLGQFPVDQQQGLGWLHPQSSGVGAGCAGWWSLCEMGWFPTNLSLSLQI